MRVTVERDLDLRVAESFRHRLRMPPLLDEERRVRMAQIVEPERVLLLRQTALDCRTEVAIPLVIDIDRAGESKVQRSLRITALRLSACSPRHVAAVQS